MPVSTRSKGKGGERGEKTAGDDSVVISKSKKPKTQREDGFTVAERCTERLARQSKAKRDARDDRKLNPKEQVIRVPLTRDNILHHFNPYKRSDLQTVLNLRQFHGLLPDIDLKECYFEKAWGFRKNEFVLAGWRDMSVEDMKEAVTEAHPVIDGSYAFPPSKVSINTLETKEDIVRAFWELTYVPAEVYTIAVGGAYVLRLFPGVNWGKVVKVTGNPKRMNEYLRWACCADLDASMIRGLAGACDLRGIDEAARSTAMCGHADVVDLLANEFDARIDAECMAGAAVAGLNSMIDHLVEMYGLDPDEVNQFGLTALQNAAMSGRVCTVKHLVEKHNVDIHARGGGGQTALDVAEEEGFTPAHEECASYLRELGYAQLVAGEYGGAVDAKLLVSAGGRGDDAIIDLLVERYGLDPNAVDDRAGWTALHSAAWDGHFRTVQHLVEQYNVDIHVRTEWDGKTALDLAEKKGRTEIASFLRELGATNGEPA